MATSDRTRAIVFGVTLALTILVVAVVVVVACATVGVAGGIETVTTTPEAAVAEFAAIENALGAAPPPLLLNAPASVSASSFAGSSRGRWWGRTVRAAGWNPQSRTFYRMSLRGWYLGWRGNSGIGVLGVSVSRGCRAERL